MDVKLLCIWRIKIGAVDNRMAEKIDNVYILHVKI
jgi:hypothetical protein